MSTTVNEGSVKMGPKDLIDYLNGLELGRVSGWSGETLIRLVEGLDLVGAKELECRVSRDETKIIWDQGAVIVEANVSPVGSLGISARAKEFDLDTVAASVVVSAVTGAMAVVAYKRATSAK